MASDTTAAPAATQPEALRLAAIVNSDGYITNIERRQIAAELCRLHALTAAPAAQEAEPAAAPSFPQRILALLQEVASRNPPPGRGVWEDGDGEPLQDDADAALAWIAARPQADAGAVPQGAEQVGEDGWPKLVKPARNGARLFGRGVSARLLVESCYRRAEIEATVPAAYAPPECWRDEVQRLSQFATTAMYMSERDKRNCLDDIAQRLAAMLHEDATPTAAAAVPAVPEGWRLVPVEPTSEMLAALSQEWHASRHRPDRYAAMLAAAPQAPAAAPNCQRCSGSGEDPEGFYDQSKGDAGHTHDGPCRTCGGSGEAPAAAVAPAAAPTQEADGWMPIETAPDGERVLLGPRHAPVVGTVHRPAFWEEEQEPTATVVHYNGNVLVAGYRCSEWHRLPGAGRARQEGAQHER